MKKVSTAHRTDKTWHTVLKSRNLHANNHRHTMCPAECSNWIRSKSENYTNWPRQKKYVHNDAIMWPHTVCNVRSSCKRSNDGSESNRHYTQWTWMSLYPSGLITRLSETTRPAIVKVSSLRRTYFRRYVLNSFTVWDYKVLVYSNLQCSSLNFLYNEKIPESDDWYK